MAGVSVIRIVNEPSAAAVAYAFAKQRGQAKNVLVFHLGGGTFDVTALYMGDNGEIRVRRSVCV